MTAAELARALKASPPPPFDVDGVIRLIREAKREGVLFFEGPGGLKFGFKREIPRMAAQPKESSDDFIP